MSSPKHLWSGDWEQESAAAAQERANREARAWPQPPETAPEPEFRPPRAPTSPPPAQPRTPRTRRRIPLPRPRVALLSALVLLLLAGAAYGLTSLQHATSATTATTKTAWLGARLAPWPAGGALVAAVASGGPAASAGLKAGDIVIQVQGRPVTAPYNVTAAIAALSPGDRLQLLVVRGSRTFPAIATLGTRPHDAP